MQIFFLDLISIVSAVVSFVGFATDKQLLMIIGAAVSVLTYAKHSYSRIVFYRFETLKFKLLTLLGAAVSAYFLYHLADVDWVTGYALSVSAICVPIAIVMMFWENTYCAVFFKSALRDFIVLIAALAGGFGYYTETSWLLTGGAVAALLFYIYATWVDKSASGLAYSSPCDHLPGLFNKFLYALIVALLGMFVLHYSFGQGWLTGATVSVCVFLLPVSVIRLLYNMIITIRSALEMKRELAKYSSDDDDDF